MTQWDLMEASVHCDTAGPHGTQESSVTQGSLGKPSVSSKHSGVSWDTGVTWILPGYLELSVPCDTSWPHGNMGTIVTQWNLMEASVSCEHGTASWNSADRWDNLESHRSKALLCQSGTS